MASLYVLENDRQMARLQLQPGTITVGRLKNNTVVLDNAGVSRQHLRIDGDPSGTLFVLEDLNSLNGTYVGARKVQACLLQNGDEIHMGKHTLVFEDN
jgi:pSer/pThr/pTyr-binding forkhead associated (FHA) protein